VCFSCAAQSPGTNFVRDIHRIISGAARIRSSVKIAPNMLVSAGDEVASGSPVPTAPREAERVAGMYET
jgi:hypothetical protein